PSRRRGSVVSRVHLTYQAVKVIRRLRATRYMPAPAVSISAAPAAISPVGAPVLGSSPPSPSSSGGVVSSGSSSGGVVSSGQSSAGVRVTYDSSACFHSLLFSWNHSTRASMESAVHTRVSPTSRNFFSSSLPSTRQVRRVLPALTVTATFPSQSSTISTLGLSPHSGHAPGGACQSPLPVTLSSRVHLPYFLYSILSPWASSGAMSFSMSNPGLFHTSPELFHSS